MPVREVLDDKQRARLVSNIAGHLSERILVRAFKYWRNADKERGDKVSGPS